MPDDNETLHAFVEIFGCGGLVFFGIWVFPIADIIKIWADVFVAIIFTMGGLMYFMVKGKILPLNHY